MLHETHPNSGRSGNYSPIIVFQNAPKILLLISCQTKKKMALWSVSEMQQLLMIFFILWGEQLSQLYISPVVKLYNKKGKMC